MRLTKEQLDSIKQKYNVDRLYSWSRVNSYITSPYEYFLRYIKHENPLREDSAYAPLGSVSHDLLEKYYTNILNPQEMCDEFENSWIEKITLGGLKFNRSDEDKDNNIKSKYFDNLVHYFHNFVPIDKQYHPVLERFVVVKVKDYVLQGYADIMWRDSDYIYIGDFKTSTAYKGKDLEHKSGQLKLYALGISQIKKVPLDKIKIAFNFLKYVNVGVTQANGQVKVRQLERHNYVEKLEASMKMWMKKLSDLSEDEKMRIVNLAIQNNTLSVLPAEVQEKFSVDDCWSYIQYTEEDIQELVDEISSTIETIEKLESEYESTKDESLFYDSIDSMKAQEYYFNELCGYSISQLKPFKDYLDEKNMFLDEQDDDEDDMKWLEGII